MPIGILGSLVICTILYILFSHVLTGLAPYTEFMQAGKEASVAYAITHHMPPEFSWLATSVTIAILAGFSSVILVMLMGQSRVFYSMSNDGLLPKAVNEGLRWVAPIGTQLRLARHDTELGGVAIPAGAAVSAILASANHDEDRFTEPRRFNLHRTEGSHAAFGFGHHFCAGRWFATAQIEIALRVLLEKLPHLQMDAARPPVFRGWEFRAPTSLHVTF